MQREWLNILLGQLSYVFLAGICGAILWQIMGAFPACWSLLPLVRYITLGMLAVSIVGSIILLTVRRLFDKFAKSG